VSVRPSTLKVPPPEDWQDFERNMRDLFEAHWNATATMHGRGGQAQDGVDFYGQPDGNGYHGVQCKDRDGRVGAKVTEAQLKAEIAKATEFRPALVHFILVTSGLRDSNIQKAVRLHNERADKPFTVDVKFWEDILLLYDEHEEVFERHYPFGAAAVDRLHQLRRPVADFTGRQVEIDDLLAHMNQGVTISGVRGMGGVGKTELAYAIADRLEESYPDAQLYLELKGTSDTPLSAADVLAFIIRCFHPDAKLPDDPDQLQGLYRSVLDGKRVLLLMDNAGGPDQLRPLCPAPAGSVLLVTSRQHFMLPGLYARDLNTLPADKACELLLTICPRLGDAAEEIAGLCGYLPLALRLAGSALACSTLEPADFAHRLRDERRRLSELDKGAKDAGEPEVTASLALSERLLPDLVRQRWYMLAVFPGDFAAAAAAAVWQPEQDEAQDTLDVLYGHSVLEWNAETKRFRLHELVRSFLRDRLAQAQPPYDEPTATRRFVEHYGVVAGEANKALLQKDGYLVGLTLFDTEWANIQAAFAVAAAAATEQPWANAAVISLCNGCPYCLDLRLHGQAKIRWLTVGLDATRRANDRSAEGALLCNLGVAHADLGEARKAIGFYEQHLRIAREIGDRGGEGAVLGNLGSAHADLGDARKAIEFYEQDLVIAREIGDRRGEGAALGNLGLAYADLGDARKAIEFYEEALAILREIGDRRGEGAALVNLGVAYKNLGDARKAIEFYEEALPILREIDDRAAEACASWNAGLACEELGDLPRAAELMQVLVDFEREIGHADAEKDAARVAALRARIK
jgi:tetratricopeptide (TPR) repeat protein